MDPFMISGYIRSIHNIIKFCHPIDIKVINERLIAQGWDIDLDYHTFQLILAGFEAEEFPFI